MLGETVQVTLQVVDVLVRLRVPYYIGGSLASAVHGVPRSTLDADLIAGLRAEHAAPLVEALRPAFYVDGVAVAEAIARRTHFNVIHLESIFKVDVFLPRGRPYDQSQFLRRAWQILSRAPERGAYVASPEDTVLSKLEWYRLGGAVAERQWQDAVGVLRVCGAGLDRDYLRHWAEELGVRDLLARALAAASS